MIQKLPKIEHIGEDYVNVEYFDRETNELTEYELPLIVADIIETFEKCSINKQKVREAINKHLACPDANNCKHGEYLSCVINIDKELGL